MRNQTLVRFFEVPDPQRASTAGEKGGRRSNSGRNSA
ncbi:KGG domain-containing protein [Sodalis praecaptivus]